MQSQYRSLRETILSLVQRLSHPIQREHCWPKEAIIRGRKVEGPMGSLLGDVEVISWQGEPQGLVVPKLSPTPLMGGGVTPRAKIAQGRCRPLWSGARL